MKKIETIKCGKNYSAVSVGKMNEIIEHELPMGPNVTIQGKVFVGQARYRKSDVFIERKKTGHV